MGPWPGFCVSAIGQHAYLQICAWILTVPIHCCRLSHAEGTGPASLGMSTWERTAAASGSTALPVGPACKCWSPCTYAGLRDFIACLPTTVHDNTSVWFHYLNAVYNGDVALPYDLSMLRFIYTNNAEWRRRHPAVEWPMASCEITGDGINPTGTYWNGADKVRELNLTESPPGVPWCSAQACKRWEERSDGNSDGTTCSSGRHSRSIHSHSRSSTSADVGGGRRGMHTSLHNCHFAYVSDTCACIRPCSPILRVHVHVCVHMLTHTCGHPNVSACMHGTCMACMRAQRGTRPRPWTVLHACIHTCTHTRMHTYTHAHIHACIHAYTHTRIHHRPGPCGGVWLLDGHES